MAAGENIVEPFLYDVWAVDASPADTQALHVRTSLNHSVSAGSNSSQVTAPPVNSWMYGHHRSGTGFFPAATLDRSEAGTFRNVARPAKRPRSAWSHSSSCIGTYL